MRPACEGLIRYSGSAVAVFVTNVVIAFTVIRTSRIASLVFINDIIV